MAKRKRLTLPDPGASSLAALPGTPLRRAPIADVVGNASAMGALDEMAETLRRAREDGRMVVSLSMDQVVLDHLIRDRVSLDRDEMDTLIASLRARGQQTPIEVVALGGAAVPPRYGLISGWRRCQALRILYEETGDKRFAYVQALLRRPEQASDAYLAMVEENEIRVGLSYFERAHIVARAVEQGVFDTRKAALQDLFHAASRAKRSKIGSFLAIVEALGDVLRFPGALGERAGLVLSKALGTDPGLAGRLTQRLRQDPPQDAAGELAILLGSGSATGRGAGGRDTPSATPQATPRQGPAKQPAGEAVAPDLWMRTGANGDITLSGGALTPELRAALTRWLKREIPGDI